MAQAQQNLQQLRDQQNQQAEQIKQLTPGAESQQQARQLAPQQETLSENTRALQQQLQSLANNNRQQNPNAANQIRAAANELGNNQTALRLERSARRSGDSRQVPREPQTAICRIALITTPANGKRKCDSSFAMLRQPLNQAGQAAGQPQERQQVQQALE